MQGQQDQEAVVEKIGIPRSRVNFVMIVDDKAARNLGGRRR